MFKVTSQHFPGGVWGKPQWGQPVLGTRLEPQTSKILNRYLQMPTWWYFGKVMRFFIHKDFSS